MRDQRTISDFFNRVPPPGAISWAEHRQRLAQQRAPQPQSQSLPQPEAQSEAQLEAQSSSVPPAALESTAPTGTDEETGTKDPVQASAEELGKTTAATTFGQFGLSLISDSLIKSRAIAFINKSRPQPQRSLVPIDSFAETPSEQRTSWASHCSVMDAAWDAYTARIHTISNGKVPVHDMSKPSGPHAVNLVCLWHYPTYNTSNGAAFSHTMDPGNGCLLLQKSKLGLQDNMRTQDVNPIRFEYVNKTGPVVFEDHYDNWSDINRASLEFTRDTTSHVPFILAVGKEPWQRYSDIVRNRGWLLHTLELDINVTMFNETPRVYLAVDRPTGEPRQLIFRSFHGEYVHHSNDLQRATVMDLMWNMACDFAGIQVEKPHYFWFKANVRKGSKLGPQNKRKMDDVMLLRSLYAVEDEENRILTVDEVKDWFSNKFRYHPELEQQIQETVDKGYSPLNAINELFVGWRKTGSAKVQKRKAELPPAPKPSKVPKDLKNDGGFKTKQTESWQNSAKGKAALAGQLHGQQVNSDKLDAKYRAFMNCYQVRQIQAARQSGQLTPAQSRALPRIDKVIECKEKGDRHSLSTRLFNFCVFYDKTKYPRGLRWENDGGPDEPDPHENEDHPAVRILVGQWKTTQQRIEVAGPIGM